MLRSRAAAIAALFLLTAAAPLPVQRRVVGTLTLENIPPTPPALAEALRPYENVRGAAFQDWLADGSMLIATRFGQTPQIHHVAFPGASREQISFYDEPVADALARPGSADRFVFRRDTGGDEYYRIYLGSLAGAAIALTPPYTRSQSPVFSRDGAWLAWASVPRGRQDYDIWVMRVDDPESKHIAFHGTGEIDPLAFSPDARKLVFKHELSAASQKLFLLDVAGGSATPINPSAGDIDYSQEYGHPAFTPDGAALVLASNQGGEFKRLVRYDLASGATTNLTGEPGWDVEGFDISPDGKTLAYSVDAGGLSTVYLRTLPDGAPRVLAGLPSAIVHGMKFAPGGKRLALNLSAATLPLDIWSVALDTGKWEQWTQSETGGLARAGFVPAAPIHFRSFDQREIPAFLYEPRAPHGKLPVIISIHGGPEAQERPGFWPIYQFWAGRLGAAVITPNVRGSAGYGRSYMALDNGAKRQDAVRDIGALLDWIATRPELDASRVVVTGGSYGGFMTLSAFAAYGDRLAGAYDIVGPSNLVTFLEHTEAYRRDLRRVEYGDERDPATRQYMEKTAPLNNTAKMVKPLFVVAGRNDPRVPYSESEQLVAKLRAQGGDVWYMVASDEGHGFRKKPNRDAERAAEALWLRKVLGLAP